MRGGRLVTVVLLAFVVLLVNAPLARSLWGEWRLAEDGVTGRVAVTDSTVRDGQFFLAVDLDPVVVVGVDEATYTAARRDGEVNVRRLRDDDDLVRVEGQVRSVVPYVFTGVVDVVLVAGVLLFTRLRPRLRPELVLRATEDLVSSGPGSVLDRIEGQRYVVAGVVEPPDADDADDELVLDLGDRRVRVVLDGYANPVAVGATALASGVMIA